MAALLEAYITNLGRYAEDGVEAGATLKFPATTEELQFFEVLYHRLITLRHFGAVDKSHVSLEI